jgi:transcriptional regulator NrdR family protein
MTSRKSLAEYYAEAAGNDPWLCPQCGCRDLRVLDTRELADGNIARTRVCRNCGPEGPRIYTTERPRNRRV